MMKMIRMILYIEAVTGKRLIDYITMEKGKLVVRTDLMGKRHAGRCAFFSPESRGRILIISGEWWENDSHREYFRK